MAKQEYAPFDHIVGVIVKGDPKLNTTPSGKSVLKFTIVAKKSYDEDEGSEFVDVAVWNEDLQQAIENGKELYKGANVALIGVRKDGGKYNDNFSAFEVYVASRIKKASSGRDF